MLRLFSKLRRSLLNEGKNARYLKYALGEIILVVIGILIALQVDNWNEWRIEREEEQMVLRQVRDDYQANLAQLDQKTRMREHILQAAQFVLHAMDHPETEPRDSVVANLSILLIDPTFDPIENDLSSNGDLRLITNQRLKRMLSNWSSDIVAVREIEQNWADVVLQQLLPAFYDLGIYRDLANHFINDLKMDWALEGTARFDKREIGGSRQSASMAEIASSNALEGIVSSAITYNATANLESEALRKRIGEILSLIEGEIEE
jgi:hypothetical protein